jgi:hypothetical protein
LPSARSNRAISDRIDGLGLNGRAGRFAPRAWNNAVIGVGTDGGVAVKCSMPAGSTHFVLDVTGYFQ